MACDIVFNQDQQNQQSTNEKLTELILSGMISQRTILVLM